jgi:low temperature requirement protein LtrA
MNSDIRYQKKKRRKGKTCHLLKLFHDVALVSQLSLILSHDISFAGILSFIALFISIWFAWLSSTFFATRFATDDLTHRIFILLHMMRAATMAVNSTYGKSCILTCKFHISHLASFRHYLKIKRYSKSIKYVVYNNK